MNAKGAAPDDNQAGGVPVVVRDGENPLHGEGVQLNRIALTDYLTIAR